MFTHLQVCLEGQISCKSAIKSLSAGHQPSGDQIPWKFAEEYRNTDFPSLSGARIVRIATHPNAMRVTTCLIHAFFLFFSFSKHNMNIYFLIYFSCWVFTAWIWFCCCGIFSKVRAFITSVSSITPHHRFLPQNYYMLILISEI